METFGGAVLNVTIDRYALASITKIASDEVIFRSSDLGQEERLPLSSAFPTSEGLRLHRGVYNRLIEDFNGGRPIPLSLTTRVGSPIGSGLGSSSALVVAMVEALREFLRVPLSDYDVARIAYQIERVDVGLNGGRQDQYAAAFGGLNFMEFFQDGRVLVNPLRLKPAYLYEFEASLLLYFTGVSRSSAIIIDNQRDSVSAGGDPLEGMHQLKTDALAMKEKMLIGDIGGVAEILTNTWEAKKRTSPAVTTAEIDHIYQIALKSGALAGKISGAGGGGFLMFLVDPDRREELIARLTGEQMRDDGFDGLQRIADDEERLILADDDLAGLFRRCVLADSCTGGRLGNSPASDAQCRRPPAARRKRRCRARSRCDGLPSAVHFFWGAGDVGLEQAAFVARVEQQNQAGLLAVVAAVQPFRVTAKVSWPCGRPAKSSSFTPRSRSSGATNCSFHLAMNLS